MANCLTFYLDTPAVQAMQERYGSQLQGMDITIRLHLMQVLSAAAAAVQQDGISERLDVAMLDAYPGAENPLLGLLHRLDGELTSYQEAAALVGAIATTIT